MFPLGSLRKAILGAPANNTQSVRKGAFISWNDEKDKKKLSNAPVGSPGDAMTNDSNFYCGIPPASDPQRV